MIGVVVLVLARRGCSGRERFHLNPYFIAVFGVHLRNELGSCVRTETGMYDAFGTGLKARNLLDHHHLHDDAIVPARDRTVARFVSAEHEVSILVDLSPGVNAVFTGLQFNSADMNWRTVGKDDLPGDRISG